MYICPGSFSAIVLYYSRRVEFYAAGIPWAKRMSPPDTLAFLISQTQPILKIFSRNILYRKNAFYKIIVDILGNYGNV